MSGVVEGFNELDAVDRIKETCSIVLKLTEVKEQDEGILNMEIGKPRLNSKAFTLMCSQFAIILRAGIPIGRTVQLIAQKTTDRALKKMLKKVAEDVEAGRGLAASFAERGENLLPTTFIETIRAGEESGNLDGAFESMQEHYDKQTKMAAKVRGALSYPLFVLVIAIVVIVVLMVKVVPTFTSIFDEYGADLPAITQLLIDMSTFFQHNWVIMAIIAVVGAVAYKLYDNTEEGRLQLAQWALKIPIMGEISTLNAASQFANTMATMLKAGLPITRSVSITARVLSNYYVSQEIGKVAGHLEEGRTLADCVRESGCMPDIMVDMVAVGEESGELEETLHTVAGYYDAELEQAVNSAVRKLEPTILVALAGFAGFIVLAVYIAIFQMYAAM